MSAESVASRRVAHVPDAAQVATLVAQSDERESHKAKQPFLEWSGTRTTAAVRVKSALKR